MVRCLRCGFTRKKANRACWKQYQLCGECAKIEHPEIYKTGKRMSILRYKQKLLKEKLNESTKE